MRALIIILLLLATPCSAKQSTNEIIYLSSDMKYVAVFSKNQARFGPTDLAIVNPEWPSSPAVYFVTKDGVQCLSIGPQATSDEYAIKRPVKKGERYKCRRTMFHVAQCFDDCRAAIIKIDRPLSGSRGGTLKGSMYVDNCRGVIILGGVIDLSKGIPLNAEWLRGEVGILADPAYPNCQSF